MGRVAEFMFFVSLIPYPVEESIFEILRLRSASLRMTRIVGSSVRSGLNFYSGKHQ